MKKKEEFLERRFSEDLPRHAFYLVRFETMLYTIKTTNAYNGIDYNNPGPAHLSMGQEASSVGQAYLLTTDDYIFGSHRSHGEILAKGFQPSINCQTPNWYPLWKNSSVETHTEPF